MDWHGLPSEDVLRRLESSTEGLRSSEAQRRLEAHGPNELVVHEPTSAGRILLDQLRSLVVGLLAAVALLALAVGDPLEAGAIGIVLLLNVLIGFVTEWRARRAMEGLSRLQVRAAIALRDGVELDLDARTLVRGDVIVLREGESVPADARLLTCTELQLNEASLTGESMPVRKSVDPVLGPQVSTADRTSMVYKGTLVVGGTGHAVVTETGAGTEIGRVSELVQGIQDQPAPIEERLAVLGARLIWTTLAVVAVVAALGILRGGPLWRTLETAIALGVAAVPEGLPVVATITLAAGMRRMARRNALVRRLPAVEALGSAAVGCSDKTGTLTTGKMSLTRIELPWTSVEVEGTGLEPVGGLRVEAAPVQGRDQEGVEVALRTGVLASRATLREEDGGWSGTGDPMDVALLVAARKAGLDPAALGRAFPVAAELPFSSHRRLLASFHDRQGRRDVYVKGAPGRLLELSDEVLDRDGPRSLRDEDRQTLKERNRELASRGLRVLAVAYRSLPSDAPATEASLQGLVFVGLVGVTDPPAPGVKETVARFRAAGVRTVMITGDQAATARAIADSLGILEAGDQVLTGADLRTLDDAALDGALGRTAVFCRVTPEQKVRVVEALQARGELVAMLGDGVNDAPALKQADIGVAMGGRGTEVASETADLVLQDDRFETVGVAIEEGRVIFDNIRKSIFYLFSCNVSEVGVLFIAAAAGLPLPLAPLQLLWLNFVTDVFPALALAAEPAEPDIMRRPPRDPDSAILSRDFMVLVTGHALLLTGATLVLFIWGLREADSGVQKAGTLAFMALALGQLLHVFNARFLGPIRSARQLLSNPWIGASLVLTLGLQLVAVYHPGLQMVLETVPLTSEDWLAVGAAAILPLILGQGWKLARKEG